MDVLTSPSFSATTSLVAKCRAVTSIGSSHRSGCRRDVGHLIHISGQPDLILQRVLEPDGTLDAEQEGAVTFLKPDAGMAFRPVLHANLDGGEAEHHLLVRHVSLLPGGAQM